MNSEKYSTFNPPDELSERIEEKETKISKITHGSSFLFTRIADKCWHVWFDRCVAATLSTEISWISCTKFRICQSDVYKTTKTLVLRISLAYSRLTSSYLCCFSYYGKS